MPDFADQLATLVESRFPRTSASDGSENDWSLVGPALLSAAVRHLRAIAHLHATLPSAVIIWQLVRSMFEYALTYAWVAADPAQRAQPWLKDDYQARIKLHNDLAGFGETLLALENLNRISARIDGNDGTLPACRCSPRRRMQRGMRYSPVLMVTCRRSSATSGVSTL